MNVNDLRLFEVPVTDLPDEVKQDYGASGLALVKKAEVDSNPATKDRVCFCRVTLEIANKTVIQWWMMRQGSPGDDGVWGLMTSGEWGAP